MYDHPGYGWICEDCYDELHDDGDEWDYAEANDELYCGRCDEPLVPGADEYSMSARGWRGDAGRSE
jgi:hypothetical protein